MSNMNKQLSLLPDDGLTGVIEKKASGSPIIGRLMKYKDGLYYVDGNQHQSGGRYVVRGLVVAWVKWQDGKPVDHKVTPTGGYHPDREELGDLDQSLWPISKFTDAPSDVWRDTRYLVLTDPKTGEDFTFVSDTAGGQRAVSDLTRAISNVRAGQPGATPIVALMSTMWKTKRGPQPRPELKVVDWLRGSAAPAVNAPQPILGAPGAVAVADDLSPEDEAKMIAAYIADGGVIG